MTKSIIILLFAFFITFLGTSQSKANTFFDERTLIKKFHTIDELESMKKGSLIKLYSDRVHEITVVVPYLALAHEAGVTLSDDGIKEDSHHIKVLSKHHDIMKKANDNTREMIEELVPYADTGKIIGSILYFEEVIKKIRLGVGSNY